MSDTPTLAEKAQGLHLGGRSSKTGIAEKQPTGISSVRSAATAAAAAYAWRKASKSKTGGGSRAHLSVMPVWPSMDGVTTPAISNGTLSPSVGGGRRLPSPGSSPALPLPFVSSPDTPVSLPTAANNNIGDGNGMSTLGETRSKVGSVERRTIDQWRMATAKARAATKVEKGDETIRKLEHQVLKLEDELRDAAAIEVALYSVVAEHASSAHKVHTPARRLARFYIHAYKNWSPERRPSIARNIVSGLVLVVRACGNDVPRS